jgi:hypothetical protein
MSKVSDMMAYCFLIPLVPLLKELTDLNLTKDQVDLVVSGIGHYAAVTGGSKVIESMVSSILKRFKSYDTES